MCLCYNITKEGRDCRGLVPGLGQGTHVGGGDAGGGYSPVLGQVATVVPGAGRHMLGCLGIIPVQANIPIWSVMYFQSVAA